MTGLLEVLTLAGIFEALLTMGCVLAWASGTLVWHRRRVVFGWWQRVGGGSAARQNWTIFGIAFAAFLIQLAVYGVPEPIVHDEFSNLLLGDTLAHGRLANPAHPFWMHFETFHELQRPDYVSMRPPGPAFALALGEKLFRLPIAGVGLSTAALCALICWMLQATAPPRWAFVGGLVSIARLGILSYWSMSYWGGSIAAIGGCLVTGAALRFLRKPELNTSALAGLGTVVIAISRPYEGAFFCAAAMGVMLWSGVRSWGVARIAVRVMPALVVIAGGILWMGYYNSRTTGDPLVTPYDLQRRTYAVMPHFWWQSERAAAPGSGSAEMRRFYTEWEPKYGEVKSAGELAGRWAMDAGTAFGFFAGAALAAPLLFAWPALGARRMLPVSIPLAATALAVLLVRWPLNPHYVASATGCVFAALVEGMRRLAAWGGGRPRSGGALVRMLLVVVALSVGIRAGVEYVFPRGATNPLAAGVVFERGAIARRLEALGGRHLVFVKYAPRHDARAEWVFNDADIDNATIVWAREVSAQSDAELRKYFAGRRAWEVEPDTKPARLTPYEEAAAP